MQEHRKNDAQKNYASNGSHLEVNGIYWDSVLKRDRTTLCNYTFFEEVAPNTLQFPFLNETIRIDLSQRVLLRQNDDNQWIEHDDPLLTLVTIMYLKSIDAVYPMGKDIVGVNDLKEGHFFTGPHEFRIEHILHRYANDPHGFRKAAKRLRGEPMEMADAAYRLLPFPRVPLYFLLWLGDEEFKPRLQVLFDRSIETYLAADAIWAMVNRVAMAFGD